MERISYEGASVIAAHQYLRAKNRTGYVDQESIKDRIDRKEHFITLGRAVIGNFFTQQYHG